MSELGSSRSSARRIVAAVAMAVAVVPSATASAADWPSGGQNLQNTRQQPAETTIGTGNVASLLPRWSFTTVGDVSATPAVDATTVYFPDSAGSLYAVDRATGTLRWQSSISAATGITSDYARATPALSGSTLVIGTQSGKFESAQTPSALQGAYVLGYDRATGALKWKTKIDSHFTTIVTQSAQVWKGVAYVGTASNEEAYANSLFSGGVDYDCCSFRGSISAIDVATGAIKWKTYMLPGDPGYSGAAVWGSTPAIDQARGALYIATGNNYSLPADRIQCVDNATTEAQKRACLTGDHFDAIVALDLESGAIRWSFEALPYDAWNTDCGLPGFDDTPGDNCPSTVGPDYDFGQGPMLFKGKLGNQKVDLVGAGEKSGDFWAVNRDTGAQVWNTKVGPGGLLGGLQWGSSTDGIRVYAAESNSTFLQRGYWAALDVSTGAVQWQTLDPSPGTHPFPGAYGYSLQGPTATANGVVYGCSLDPTGTMVAMSAATGAILWQYASGTSCLGGAAISDGTVYWGTGYRSFFPLSSPGNKLFAFTLNGL
jgi:polyvinyl alcohol dehydrogenase (cytochrome)